MCQIQFLATLPDSYKDLYFYKLLVHSTDRSRYAQCDNHHSDLEIKRGHICSSQIIFSNKFADRWDTKSDDY